MSKEIGETFGYWMVKFYSVSDSKSGIQFGFKLNFDPNLDLNETILDLHSSGGLQTRNTHIDTQREKCCEGRRLIGKTEIYTYQYRRSDARRASTES